MHRKQAAIFLVGCMFLCLCIVLWFGFTANLSIAFFVSVFIGLTLGLLLVAFERRNAQSDSNRKWDQKTIGVAIGPLIGIALVGVMRIFAVQDLLALFASSACTMMMVFLFWLIFLRSVDSSEYQQDVMGNIRTIHEEADWQRAKERLQHKHAAWSKQRRRW